MLFRSCGFLLERILISSEYWPRDVTRLIAAVFVLTPAYGAGVALIDFQYTQSLLLFLFGTWLLIGHSRLVRVLGVPFIFWSLFVPSFQVFIVVVIALFLAKRHHESRQVKLNVFLTLLLLSFPLIHRYAIPMFFPSLKTVDGYNSIQPVFLFRAILVFVILLMPALWFGVKLHHGLPKGTAVRLLVVGSALLALGSFPYLAVGHFANLSDWVLPFLTFT